MFEHHSEINAQKRNYDYLILKSEKIKDYGLQNVRFSIGKDLSYPQESIIVKYGSDLEPEDLDLSPFDHKGGLGRFYDVFGDSYESILQEMNVELVA